MTYRRLTELHIKLDSRTDAAAAWVEASRAFTKANKRPGAAWRLHCPPLEQSLGSGPLTK